MRMHINNNREQGKIENVQESKTDRCAGSGEKAIRADIDKLCVKSREGLWGLLIFLTVSIITFTFRDQGLTNCLEPGLRLALGPAPPILLVNILMGISIFSSLVLIGGRVFHGWEPGNTWTHLFFRLLFYLLYFVVDSLSGYYHAVFISGLVVLVLQHYNIWSYASMAISNRLTVGAIWPSDRGGCQGSEH